MQGEVAGYVLKQVPGTPNFRVLNKDTGRIAQLQEGIQDWSLELCKEAECCAPSDNHIIIPHMLA